jgi:hypothetical protein
MHLRECRPGDLGRLLRHDYHSNSKQCHRYQNLFFIPCFCWVYHATKVKMDLRVGVTCSSGMRQESVGLSWLYFRPGLN